LENSILPPLGVNAWGQRKNSLAHSSIGVPLGLGFITFQILHVFLPDISIVVFG